MFTVYDVLGDESDSPFTNYSVDEVLEFFEDVHQGFLRNYKIFNDETKTEYSYVDFVNAFG